MRGLIDSDWKFSFDLSELGLVRIHSNWCLGLSRIDFWPFFIKQDTKRFSDWFGMTWNGSETDSWMCRNSSDSVGMNFNPILWPGYCTWYMCRIHKMLILYFLIFNSSNILQMQTYVLWKNIFHSWKILRSISFIIY